MATLSKRKITINKKDLKQAVLNANKKLDARNKTLKDEVKTKENEIKSLNDQIKSSNSELKSLLNTICENKTLISKENLNLNKLSNDVKSRESHILTLKNEESSIKDNVKELKKEASKIEDDSAKLFAKNKEKEDLAKEVKSIKKQKQLEESELNEIQRKHWSIKEKVSYEELRLEKTSKSHQKQIDEMSSEYEATLKVIDKEKQNLLDAKNAHTDFINNSQKEIEEKSLELKALESLASKQEDEYVKWERKIENIKKSIESENTRIDLIKKNFENWKVNALEGVAKMKLKNKIETIDKAGLQEILNG